MVLLLQGARQFTKGDSAGSTEGRVSGSSFLWGYQLCVHAGAARRGTEDRAHRAF